jgi:hypothetical protein
VSSIEGVIGQIRQVIAMIDECISKTEIVAQTAEEPATTLDWIFGG